MVATNTNQADLTLGRFIDIGSTNIGDNFAGIGSTAMGVVMFGKSGTGYFPVMVNELGVLITGA